jgi:hypothetical protein
LLIYSYALLKIIINSYSANTIIVECTKHFCMKKIFWFLLVLLSISFTTKANYYNYCSKISQSVIADFTPEEVDLIKSNYGEIDLNSFQKTDLNEKEFYETYTLKTPNNTRRTLYIVVNQEDEEKKYNVIIKEITDESGAEIIDVNNLSDAKIVVYLLNDGYSLTRKADFSEIFGGEITPISARSVFRSFGTCFKTCVASHIMHLSWLEAAACVLAPPECAAMFLVGCSACCIVNKNDGLKCTAD